jgi:hypothetical protein
MFVFHVNGIKINENTFSIVISAYLEKPYITIFDADRNIYINRVNFVEFFNLLSVEQKEEVLYHLDIFDF